MMYAGSMKSLVSEISLGKVLSLFILVLNTFMLLLTSNQELQSRKSTDLKDPEGSQPTN